MSVPMDTAFGELTRPNFAFGAVLPRLWDALCRHAFLHPLETRATLCSGVRLRFRLGNGKFLTLLFRSQAPNVHQFRLVFRSSAFEAVTHL
mmetsp:Transcript_29258/g.93151  ORF Transcript_29258/g.93151 Transcript_29258/m.93151 type:complete len:91 (+) Transcript_29258:336-608(+)